MTTIKPVLKWVGGKTQIIENIMELFPKEINNYYEPFVGGGSVLFTLLSYIKCGKITIHEKIYASDLNVNLIYLYKNIQQYPNELIKCVKMLTEEASKCTGEVVNRDAKTFEEAQTSCESYYYWIRKQFNTLNTNEKKTLHASAMLIYMNKTCFRGVYREGPKGFNVPFGHYKNPTIIDETHILAVSELIKDVVFTQCSFIDALVKVEKEDFIYMDPPYAPEKATSFVGYTSDGFSLEQHETLFRLCGIMKEKGVKFLMSNADVDLIKKAFPIPTYIVRIIECRRAINAKKPDAKTNEVLIE